MLKTHRLAFASVALLFFLFGFITCLNDILVPHLKAIFALNYQHSMLIQFAFFSAYFVFSIPAAQILRRFGYARGIVVGLLLASLGALGFLPAGYWASYPFFLSAIFILACGITLIQVAANPYITALGPVQSASARLNFAQALNSLGTTLAPLVGSTLILSSATEATAQNTTALPYLTIALTLAVVALALTQISLPQITDEILEKDLREQVTTTKDSSLFWGILAIFCYVGAEVGIGSFLTNYIMFCWNFPADHAGRFVAIYWFLMMLGRFGGTYLLTRYSASTCLKGVALLAVCLVSLSVFLPREWSPYFLVSVGLPNSIMFPVIFSLSIAGLGKNTSRGASYLCMAIVGGAILPFLQGYVADELGIRWGFVLPLFAYLYLNYFALRMSRVHEGVDYAGEFKTT